MAVIFLEFKEIDELSGRRVSIAVDIITSFCEDPDYPLAKGYTRIYTGRVVGPAAGEKNTYEDYWQVHEAYDVVSKRISEAKNPDSVR